MGFVEPWDESREKNTLEVCLVTRDYSDMGNVNSKNTHEGEKA